MVLIFIFLITYEVECTYMFTDHLDVPIFWVLKSLWLIEWQRSSFWIKFAGRQNPATKPFLGNSNSLVKDGERKRWSIHSGDFFGNRSNYSSDYSLLSKTNFNKIYWKKAQYHNTERAKNDLTIWESWVNIAGFTIPPWLCPQQTLLLAWRLNSMMHIKHWDLCLVIIHLW